jgi:flagellar biosynthesis activator protein FlaF
LSRQTDDGVRAILLRSSLISPFMTALIRLSDMFAKFATRYGLLFDLSTTSKEQITMLAKNYAVRAYRTASNYKSQREIEADVFRLVIDGLRAANDHGNVQKVKAVADNRRLWVIVQSVVTDPANELPKSLRAQILSLSLAMQREMNVESPDLGFLIAVNESMVAGLIQ